MTVYGEENAQPPVKPGTVVAQEPYEIRHPVTRFLAENAARATIMPLLRPGDSFDRVLAEVFHAVRANPKIGECEPASLVASVARAVETGLVIGVSVYLVPFWDKKANVLRCQSIIGYNGLIELVKRAGGARFIDAHCVYANDEFSHEQGTQPVIRHKPVIDPAKRGTMVAAYAIAWITSTQYVSVILHEKEINDVRKRYSQKWKDGNLPYWYAQKTCVRRIVKLLPKNAALAKVLAMLDKEDDEPGEVGPVRSLASAPLRVSAAEAVSQTPNGEAQPAWMDGEPGDDFGAGMEDFGEEPHSEATAEEDPDHPLCPVCGGPMEDLRQKKGKPTWPDFRCAAAPRTRNGPGCTGVIWPD